MSWLGVKYALACRDERVKLGARLVLVGLGVRVEHRRITTSPTSLSDLQWVTLMSHEQIRRVLDDLEEWKKVRRIRRGKNAVYALPEMAGPLFAVDDGDPVRMTDFVLDNLPEKIGQDARKVVGRMPGFRRRMTDFSGHRAEGVLFSKEILTEVHNHHPHTKPFDLWWTETFPVYNGGAQSSLSPDLAYPIIDELLETRTLQRVQLMSVVCWSVGPRESRWIAESDRGLRVVKHMADWLDRYVSTMPPWWHDCRHTPKCQDPRDCHAHEAVS